MSIVDVKSIADELRAAYANRSTVSTPSGRGIGFDMTAAYAVEAELTRMRRDSGQQTVGRKVGFANKAMWRILKLDTLVWAHMYDDTVRHAPANHATLSLAGMVSPRIEPEIVFKLAQPMPAGRSDAAAALAHVEWLALGFEVNDCLFPDWQFQPADFVAAYGLHAALVIGEPRAVTPDMIDTLVEQLPRFTLRLAKDSALVEEGSGKQSLRSPALCLGELAAAVSKGDNPEPLDAGEIISTGTLTTPQPIAAGQTWNAQVAGLDLPDLSLRLQ